MRVGPKILFSLVLLGVLAVALAFLQPRLGGFSAWFYVASAAFVLTRRAVVHARDGEEPPPPETSLRRYGAGLVAWVLLGLFWSEAAYPAHFAVALGLLYTVNFGLVGMRKATSAATRCLVALAHFAAPATYVAHLLTLPN